MDIEVILDAAEVEAPELRELARRFLEAETWHLGVPLDETSVLVRRAEGTPEVHITGAANFLEHLAATEPDGPRRGSALVTLARAGAQAMLTRAEIPDAFTPGLPVAAPVR